MRTILAIIPALMGFIMISVTTMALGAGMAMLGSVTTDPFVALLAYMVSFTACVSGVAIAAITAIDTYQTAMYW